MTADPAVVANLHRFSKSEREAVADDVRGQFSASMEERSRLLAEACRLEMALVDSSDNPERALSWQDPPHATYSDVMYKLRKRAKAKGWRWQGPTGPASGSTLHMDVVSGERAE
jgi:hypothetical protein